MHSKTYLDIGALANDLGEDICNSLLLFHRLTGSDTTSYFFNIGKRTAFKVQKAHPKLLAGLSKHSDLTEDQWRGLFTCCMGTQQRAVL